MKGCTAKVTICSFFKWLNLQKDKYFNLLRHPLVMPKKKTPNISTEIQKIKQEISFGSLAPFTKGTKTSSQAPRCASCRANKLKSWQAEKLTSWKVNQLTRLQLLGFLAVPEMDIGKRDAKDAEDKYPNTVLNFNGDLTYSKWRHKTFKMGTQCCRAYQAWLSNHDTNILICILSPFRLHLSRHWFLFTPGLGEWEWA